MVSFAKFPAESRRFVSLFRRGLVIAQVIEVALHGSQSQPFPSTALNLRMANLGHVTQPPNHRTKRWNFPFGPTVPRNLPQTFASPRAHLAPRDKPCARCPESEMNGNSDSIEEFRAVHQEYKSLHLQEGVKKCWPAFTQHNTCCVLSWTSHLFLRYKQLHHVSQARETNP